MPEIEQQEEEDDEVLVEEVDLQQNIEPIEVEPAKVETEEVVRQQPPLVNKSSGELMPFCTFFSLMHSIVSQDLVLAKYAHEAQEANELSFAKGDIIVVHKRHRSGWWKGSCQSTGESGVFPGNYTVCSS